MIYSIALTTLVTLGLGFAGADAPQGEQPPQDPATAVARLLGERCSDCHRPGSDEPKATRHWPDARDLAKTVQDPELIVAGVPDDSNLFLAISFGDMPPPDSGVAPLSEAEQALVEAWIRDGAAVPTPTALPPVSGEAGASPETPSGWMQTSPVRWLSHFHPLVVHFPVALLTAALIAELLAGISGHTGLRTAATFCLALGAFSALPTAGLGWLLAENSSHRGSELFNHRWLGVSTAVLSLLVLWGGH